MLEAVTHERLVSILHYDPVVGVFIWKKKFSKKLSLGHISTNIDSKGYRRIGVDGVRYREHRLAWFYMTKEWPPEEVDHINGNRKDNSFSNLRLATRAENKRNTPTYKNNKSGFKGVSWHVCSKKWRSRFFKNGKEVNLGLFDTPEEAHKAYIEASVNNYGEFAKVDTNGRKR